MLLNKDIKTNLILNDVPNEQILKKIQEEGKLEPNQFYETPDISSTDMLFPEPDSELSVTSENSIQNKAVTLELQDKVSISQAQTIYGQKVFDAVPKVGSVRLPVGLTELNYIESTGTQYINTRFSETNTWTCDCKFEILENSKSYLYGGRQNSNSYLLNGLYANSILEYNWTTALEYQSSNIIEMTQRISEGNTIITINDETVTVPTATNTSGYNIFIFACNNATIRYFPSALRLYYFKMYDNNVLIRDFIPCYVNTPINFDGITYPINTIGLYDLVEGKFYTNQGTGTFLKGADLLQGEYLTLHSELPIPNNGEETTEILTSLKINNTNYNIAGGSGGSTTT